MRSAPEVSNARQSGKPGPYKAEALAAVSSGYNPNENVSQTDPSEPEAMRSGRR